MSIGEVLARLKGVRKSGGGAWSALCPAHSDTTPSLSVAEGKDRRVLLKCHRGCDLSAILGALGLDKHALFDETGGAGTGAARVVAEYRYEDERGVHLFDVVRFEPKGFRQRAATGEWSMRDVRRVLYHLPKLVAAVEAGRVVFVAEGEKDVHALEDHGFAATTNPGGAGKWRPEYTTHLAGALVVLLPDNDPVGRQHMEAVARDLVAVAREVRIVALPGVPEKGDVSDWFSAGGTADALKGYAQVAQVLDSSALARTASLEPALDKDATRPLIAPLRYHTLAELSEHPELMAEPDPIVSPFLYRGRSTLLAGREKMGKSTLAAHAVAALSNGQEFLGSRLRRGRVLWYSLDEGMADTVRRFLALGASPLDVMICPDRPTFEQVAEKVAEFTPDVVVFDTLNELLPGMDLNRGEQVAPALRPYVQVLRDANVAGCILCHASKSRGEYLGDVRLGGVVDCVLTLKEPRPEPVGDTSQPTEAPRDNEEDGPRLLVGKSRWGGKIHMRLTSPDGRHYVLGEAPLSLEVRLLRALRDSDLSGNDLQERVSGNRQRIQHAIRELRDCGRIEQAKTRYRITAAGLAFLDGGAEMVPACADLEEAGTTFTESVSAATSATERAGTISALLGTISEPVQRKLVPAPHTPYPDAGTTSAQEVLRII